MKFLFARLTLQRSTLKRSHAALLLASLGLLVLSGCATTSDEASGYSERPWNTPRSWETGLPSSLNEGR
jgi:hypothetical protein